MKQLRIPSIVAAASLCRLLWAEDVVTLRLEHSRLLQFEPVVAFVSIRNVSEDVLVFEEGKEGEPSLSFRLDKGPTDLIRKKRNGSQLAGKLRILPGDTREAMIELSLWHDLTAMGVYVVTAAAEYEGQRFVSRPVRFEVENGLPMGQPVRMATGGGLAARIFSLRYMSREDFERLFLRVDEEGTGVNFGSFEVGPLIRVKQPEMKVDTDGEVTVVHESGSGRFTRSIFKSRPEGVAFVDQTYHHEDGAAYQYKEKGRDETSR